MPRRLDGSRPSVTKTVHGTETEAKRVERELLHQRDNGKLVMRAKGGFAAYCEEWYEAALRHMKPELVPSTWRELQPKPALSRRRDRGRPPLSGHRR